MGEMGAGKGSARHADLIDAVRARWERISGRCGSAVADGSSRVPFGLEAVVQAIEAYPSTHAGRDDGEFHHGITLRQLLDDFGLFRRLMIEEVSDELVRPMELDETLCLNSVLDHLTAAAVEQLVSSHYRGVEQAVEGQNSFLRLLRHEVGNELNLIVLNLQLLRQGLSGVSAARDSLEELDQLRRTILSTMQKLYRTEAPPQEMVRRTEGSVRAG
jgi:hypothetical protein